MNTVDYILLSGARSRLRYGVPFSPPTILWVAKLQQHQVRLNICSAQELSYTANINS